MPSRGYDIHTYGIWYHEWVRQERWLTDTMEFVLRTVVKPRELARLD